MAVELWHQLGKDAAVTLTPVAGGRLEVYIDGVKAYDRIEEARYPGLDRVRELVKQANARLEAAPA